MAESNVCSEISSTFSSGLDSKERWPLGQVLQEISTSLEEV